FLTLARRAGGNSLGDPTTTQDQNGPIRATLVSLDTKDATNSACMLGEPLTHPVIGPGPFEGVSVASIVLRPRRFHMGEVLLPARPGAALQVPIRERMIEQFCLIQPRSMGWGQPRSPPALAGGEVVRRL